ncbi:acyl-CoA thioesterase [Advenella sp. RU8]|uniref:acyl-CoA thioesterase n=1 Tax=Advenella sp. RU8 TaxID=3399575 RepID=UPI003AAC7DA8
MDNFCLPANLAGSFKHGIHSFSFALRWGDMDMLGHLNNTIYFRAMEEARIEFINAIRPCFEPGMGVVVGHLSCDFLRPMNYPGNAMVLHELTRMGRSSMEHKITIEKEGEPGVVYATARSVLVFSNLATGRSSPWTEQMREIIQKLFSQE